MLKCMSYDSERLDITYLQQTTPSPYGMYVYELLIQDTSAVQHLMQFPLRSFSVRPDFSGARVSTYMNLVMLSHDLCMQQRYLSRDKKQLMFIPKHPSDKCEDLVLNLNSNHTMTGLYMHASKFPRGSIRFWRGEI